MMAALTEIPGRLYRGEVSINFVGRAKLWYMISGGILLVAIVALAVRGLNFSIDFKGGSILQFNAANTTLTHLQSVLASTPAGGQAVVQHVGATGWQIQSAKLDFAQTQAVENAIMNAGVTVKGGVNGFSPTVIGASWGSQISDKALEALIAFLIVIVIYLSIAFEWKMASAAFVALMHDIVITIGVYALFGFSVSPASVIGLLTILGYSLYDTVVVFDKVRENTAGLLGSAKSNYSQAANLALNQTLVRSINTSLIALLPVTAILIISTAALAPGNELSDLALVLFVGMLSGTYSSIFIATPVLSNLKERERQYKALAKRVALREAGGRSAAKRQAKAGATAKAGVGTAVADPGVADDGTTAQEATAPAGRTGRTVRPANGAGSPTAFAIGQPAAAADLDDLDDGAGDDTSSSVSAGQGLPGVSTGPGSVRTGPRQQPRRTSAAGRKKKKR
jgi:preprotein translocase subunit SecF